jgi:hypothetical protein
MVGMVWVIELHELAEAVFGVGDLAGMGEDLVRCGYGVWVDGLRPVVYESFIPFGRWKGILDSGIWPSSASRK